MEDISRQMTSVFTEGLLDFFACGEEPEVYEGCNSDTRNGVPLEQIDQLER